MNKLAEIQDIPPEKILERYKRITEKLERINRKLLKSLLLKLSRIGKVKKDLGRKLLKDLIKMDEVLLLDLMKIKREVRFGVLEINLKEKNIKYWYEMLNTKGGFFMALQALAFSLENIFPTQFIPKRFVKKVSARFVDILYNHFKKNREISPEDLRTMLTIALTIGIPSFYIKKAVEYIEKKYIKY